MSLELHNSYNVAYHKVVAETWIEFFHAAQRCWESSSFLVYE